MEKVAIVCFLHGNEGYGLEVCKNQSFFPFFIGNPIAMKANKRFIEKDMNRCFPGKLNGCIEEIQAYNLLKKIKNFDFLIDLHSTSNNCPMFGIITKPNKEKIEFAKKLGLKKLVIMNDDLASGNSLIDNVKCGISLEVGPHERKKNISETLEIISNFKNKTNYTDKLEIFEVKTIIKKQAKNVLIKNFQKIEKGQVIAKDETAVQKADFDFIAVLVSEKSYGDTLCLAAQKTSENIYKEDLYK